MKSDNESFNLEQLPMFLKTYSEGKWAIFIAFGCSVNK